MTAIQLIANHLWQSTIFAVAAGLLTLALRKNAARTRYRLWLAASVKFLVPFSILVMVGSHFGRTTTSETVPVTLVIEQVSQPFGTPVRGAIVGVSQAPATNIIPAIIWATWAIGFVFVVCSWWRRSRSIREALSAASPLDLPFAIQVMSSPAILGPGVFGIWRPALLLPEGITNHLTTAEMDAILAHELCHVRRRDNLATVAHMVVEALFWFHPLVWWLGARLMEERENACDEEVLRSGSEPQVYAEGILKICELYLESPLPCVSGVTGSNLKKRIEVIMSNRVVPRLNFAKKIVLTVAGVAALAAPVIVGVMSAPAVHAQSAAQTAPAGPKFEVASIKAAAPGVEFMFGVRPMPGGRMNAANVTLKQLIEIAYGLQDFQLIGGQGWIETARYNIEAKPDSPTGPNEWKEMLKNLLADRFQLAFHRETRELPAYALVLAKKDGRLGPRMVESKEGSCVARDPSKPLGPPGSGQQPFCGNVLGGVSGLTATTATPGDIAPMLSRALGRKVIDKTGLTGKYDITLEYTPDENQLGMRRMPGVPPPPAPADTSGPSLFTALQEQLGLKLEPQKAPVEVFVIERAEKPSEN